MDPRSVIPQCTRRNFLALAGGAVAAGAAAGQQAEAIKAWPPRKDEAEKPPNVLVLILDSLRADHLSVFDYPRSTSPFIDSLAREGFRFTRAISQSSYTRESVSSIFTGLFPSESGSTGWEAKPNYATLAEQFKEAGYRTGLFTDTAMLMNANFRRGFDRLNFESRGGMASGMGPTLSRKAAAFANADPGKPFFAYVHYIDPHGPYSPPRAMYMRMADKVEKQPLLLYKYVRPQLENLKQSGFGPGEHRFEDMVSRYDAEIAHVDYAIGVLFDLLDQAQQLDNTIVVVAADHGEEFLDHGFVEHAWRLYNESTHVPLIFWAPGKIPAGSSEQRVALLNLFPTLLSMAGVENSAVVSGQPLFEKKDGQFMPRAIGEPIVSELMIQSRNLVRTIVSGDWKYTAAVQWYASEKLATLSRDCGAREKLFSQGKKQPADIFGPTVYEELFYLPDDPNEQTNVADAETSTRDTFREALERYYAHCKSMAQEEPKEEAAPETPMSEDDVSAMEALGYI